MFVNPDDVRAYLGMQPDQLPDAKVQATLNVVEPMVRAYTRGNGFDSFGMPNEAIAAVIISATGRLITNPTALVMEAVGAHSYRAGVFDGWTLPELAILHLYRRRTA